MEGLLKTRKKEIHQIYMIIKHANWSEISRTVVSNNGINLTLIVNNKHKT